MLPVRAAADRLEVPPERARTNRGKRTVRHGGIAKQNADRSQHGTHRLASVEKGPCRCRCAGWMNETAESLPWPRPRRHEARARHRKS